MDVKDYCKGVEMELATWKAKMYDLTRKIDKLPTGDKQKMLANVEDLHIIVAELGDRIDQLRTECPTEWSPQKSQIEDAHRDIRTKFEDAVAVLGAGNFGG